jgi:hypothetical protein
MFYERSYREGSKMKCFNCKQDCSLQGDSNKIIQELGKYSPADVDKFLKKLRALPGASFPMATICYKCFMKEVMGKEI